MKEILFEDQQKKKTSRMIQGNSIGPRIKSRMGLKTNLGWTNQIRFGCRSPLISCAVLILGCVVDHNDFVKVDDELV